MKQMFCALTSRVDKKNTASLTPLKWAPTLQQLTQRNPVDRLISKSKNLQVVCIQVVHTLTQIKIFNEFYNICTRDFSLLPQAPT